jgi:hypothetical protein
MANTFYIVSDEPDRIEPVDEDPPTHYATPEDAGDGIMNGFHGEAGQRYVLKVTIESVVEYNRSWTLVRKD